MSNNYPIGVFDSGIGGLSVLKWLRKELPNENFIYIADSGHNPYGDKPRQFIEERSILLTKYLLKQKAKAIVVACNTATAAAIATLRSMYSIPFIGMEPGIKPALAFTQTGVVGILATKETLNSQKFETLRNRFSNECRFEVQECHGLVELVEQIDFGSQTAREFVGKYVQSLLDKGVDTIVLGRSKAYRRTTTRKVIRTISRLAQDTPRPTHSDRASIRRSRIHSQGGIADLRGTLKGDRRTGTGLPGRTGESASGGFGARPPAFRAR